MQKKVEGIASLTPVRSVDLTSGLETRTPTPALFSNIPMLRKFLELTVEDWRLAASPFQSRIDNSLTESEQFYHKGKAFVDLQPYYLKCLFSYVTFFVALEHAYHLFYSELNVLNKESFLRVPHNKPPKKNAYIEKVRRVRNISIAHIGSDKANSKVTASAAMMWKPMTWGAELGQPWNLDNMTFGEFKIVVRDPAGTVVEQSDDLEIRGIIEVDVMCTAYLDEYEEVCADFLHAIAQKLPYETNNFRYSIL
jgi:hypothetical protein